MGHHKSYYKCLCCLFCMYWLYWSSHAPRYFTMIDLSIVCLSISMFVVIHFDNICLKPKMIYSVLSLFNLCWFPSIHPYISPIQCCKSCIHFDSSPCLTGVNSFFTKWSSMNPFSAICPSDVAFESDGISLIVLAYARYAVGLAQLPWGMLNCNCFSMK